MSSPSSNREQSCLFISYRHSDGLELAMRLQQDLKRDFQVVWRDQDEIRGGPWSAKIEEGLGQSVAIVYLMTPHSTRRGPSASHPYSVCLDEICKARWELDKPIVPILADKCSIPLPVVALHYLNGLKWKESEQAYQKLLEETRQAVAAALRDGVRFGTWASRPERQSFDLLDLRIRDKRRDFQGREWLFTKIEEWCLHRDQRVLLIQGDPGAGKSAMLAELVYRNPKDRVLAYYFCDAQRTDSLKPMEFLRTVVAQIAGQFAEQVPAWAASLEDPKVQQALNPNTELDLVSAFQTALFVPLSRLDGLLRPETGFLVVDALDESLKQSGPTILSLLATLQRQFPPWLRLVLSARRDSDVETAFSGVPPLIIDAQATENLDDIEKFIRHRFNTRPDLQKRLTQAGLEPTAGFELMQNRREGNFLVVQQTLDALEKGLLKFKDLDKLAPGLHGLYDGFFERQFPEGNGYDKARQLLRVAVAAREPLTGRVLSRVAGFRDETEMTWHLGKLTAFLLKRNEYYAVYHQSLTDWLLDREQRRHRFAIGHKEAHGQFVEWCRQVHEYSWADASAEEQAYVVRHFRAHLREAAARIEDFQFLTDRRWKERWEQQVGGLAGFLEDVDWVWESASASNQRRLRAGEPLIWLGLEIRCALLCSSGAEMTRLVGPHLLVRLVETGLWSSASGLAYARQLSDPVGRSHALVGLLSLSSDRNERSRLLANTLESGEAIQNPEDRSEFLRHLGWVCHRQQWHDGMRQTVMQLPDSEQRIHFFYELGMTSDLVATAKEVTDPARRSRLLQELGQHAEALDAARHVSDPEERTRLLHELGRKEEALAAAKEVTDPNGRARLLQELGQQEETLAAAQEVADPARRSRLLRELGRYAEALDAARDVIDPERRAGLLRDLRRYAEALDAARDVIDPDRKARLLQELGRYAEALDAARDVIDPDRKARLLQELGRYAEALDAARDVIDPERRAGLLRDLRRYAEALDAARDVIDPDRKARLLQELGQQEEALDAARDVIDPDRKARLLQELGQQEEALDAAWAVIDPERKARLFRDLGQQEEALAAARDVIDPERKARLFRDLGRNEEALAATKEVTDPERRARLLQELGQQEEALVGVARHVTDPEKRAWLFRELGRKEEALAAARDVTDPEERTRLLQELGGKEEALDAARIVSDPERRARLFRELGRKEEALAAARDVTDPDRKARLLQELGQQEEALDAAWAVIDPERKARLFRDLGQQEEALDAARHVSDPERRAWLCRSLANYFAARKDFDCTLEALTLLPDTPESNEFQIHCVMEENEFPQGPQGARMLDWFAQRLTEKRYRQFLEDLLGNQSIPLAEETIRKAHSWLLSREQTVTWSRGRRILIRRYCNNGKVEEAWQVARDLLTPGGSATTHGEVLLFLARHWPARGCDSATVPQLAPVLAQAVRIEPLSLRARVLDLLAPHLADRSQVQQCAAGLHSLDDQEERARARTAFITLEEDDGRVADTLKKIRDLRMRSQAIARVAGRASPSLLEKLLSIIKKLPQADYLDNPHERAIAAMGARELVAGEQSRSASIFQKARQHPDRWVEILRWLAINHPGRRSVRRVLRQEIGSLEQKRQCVVLLGLVHRPRLFNRLAKETEVSWAEILRAIRQIPLPMRRKIALRKFAAFWPDDLLTDVLEATYHFLDPLDTLEILVLLIRRRGKQIPGLPSWVGRTLSVPLATEMIAFARQEPTVTLGKMRELLRGMSNGQVRRRLTLLLARLTVSQDRSRLVRDALELVLSLEGTEERVKALLEMPRLPEDIHAEELEQLAHAIAQFDQHRPRARAWRRLRRSFTGLERPRLYAIWKKLLPILARRSRPLFVADLASLARVITSLAGPEVARAIFAMLQEVGEWWL